MNRLRHLIAVPALGLAFCLSAAFAGAKPSSNSYDLGQTDGMQFFTGSTNARDILAREGFVVAAPDFAQIYDPYIESPLPVLITVDSVWHTYHFLLEQGELELEQNQVDRLARFSAALARAAAGTPGCEDIAAYASVGLALQDDKHRAALKPDQHRIVDALLLGSAPVDVPIGFPLSPAVFCAQGFYTESPELTRLYAAWQWYATVDFRLSNARETALALRLSWLIESSPELFVLWKKLSDPYDALVAPPDDGTVNTYMRVAQSVAGRDFSPAAIDGRLGEIQRKLSRAAQTPRLTDEILPAADYAPFSKLTAGFRLLPARQLPDAICLRNCVDPAIPQRACPSGLDFMVASKVLQSPAALRAFEGVFGKQIAKAVRKADPGPMPDSLYGRSMALLALLQKPLPSRAPAPFRSEAWADLQLWTQLGAWAEQRHMGLDRASPIKGKPASAKPPSGIVEPYPELFSGLAILSQQTSDALGLGDKSPVTIQLAALTKICNKLALLAREQLAGEALTQDESEWIRDYGTALAALNAVDFPNVSRIFNITSQPYIFLVGVAHPQALYVILPANGKSQLYRGAVMSYREFVGYKKVNLDDAGWQKIVRANKTPPPPAFTASFLRN